MTAAPARDKPVTRDDIEAKLRQIRGEVDSTTDRAKVPAIAVGVAAVVVVVGVAFLLGRRRGKRMTTVVEVRRV